MSKDKYIDLAGHPGVRIRVERLNGNPLKRDAVQPPDIDKIWWDEELIVFMVPASPRVTDINAAADKALAAAHAFNVDASRARAEVVMFHGTFVKVEVWCPPGTAKRLGIKGYGS